MKQLTAMGVKKLSKPGGYADGGCLYLQVRDVDHKSWLFRYTLGGRSRAMGLGAFPDVSLQEARDQAEECRRLLRQSIDPLDHRVALRAELAAQQHSHTFREVAELYIAAHKDSWRNAKHRAQWTATLEAYAYPVLGEQPVAAIDVGGVMRVLEPMWKTKNETASRLRGRIEKVLDYATAQGWRKSENPARWSGHLDNLLQSRSKVAPVEHHAALHYANVAGFMAVLRADEGVAARALEFIVLTAERTYEALGAKWSEVDLAGRLWVVPAERMKAGREHRVPLSAAACSILEAMQKIRSACDKDGYVFPGRKKGAPLSNMAPTMVLRRKAAMTLRFTAFAAHSVIGARRRQRCLARLRKRPSLTR
jgi:integrase